MINVNPAHLSALNVKIQQHAPSVGVDSNLIMVSAKKNVEMELDFKLNAMIVIKKVETAVQLIANRKMGISVKVDLLLQQMCVSNFYCKHQSQ